MNNFNWKQNLVFLVIGIAVGMGVCTAQRRYRFSHPWDGQKKTEYLLHKFSSKLDLTPQQEKDVAVILKTKREKMEAMRKQVHPQFEEIRNTTRDEIRKLLTPEQQQKFDDLDAKMRKRWKRRSS